MMQQRYFRANEAVYEAMRSDLDAAWGMPNPGTVTCFIPAADPTVPRDLQGRVYLAVHAEWCGWIPVIDMLPEMIASGVIEEVDRQDYLSAMPDLP